MRPAPRSAARLIAAAALLLAVPVSAQFAAPDPNANTAAAAIQNQRKIINVVVYGDDKCPVAQAADEVVVCSRQPETKKYRVQPSQQGKTERPEEGGGSRAIAIDQVGRTGPDVCSAVGPAGASGCARAEMMNNKAMRRALKAEAQNQ